LGEFDMSVTGEKISGYEASEEVKLLFALSAECWSDRAQAEEYMNQALEKAGDDPDVWIAAYRLFFYSNNPTMAFQVAEKILNRVRVAENLPQDWATLKPILLERKDEDSIRLFLNAYAASGYLLAKMGELEQAKTVTQRIKEIDRNRESCATTVFEVLTQLPENEEE
jgi:tetratricopeptide (TPR) repeat protein